MIDLKKILITFSLLFLVLIKAIACTCGIIHLKDSQANEIEDSECIFIGEITDIYDDLSYKIKVTESLDGGDSIDNIYIGQNSKSCYPYVENKGKWIVYGKMENGFLKMNICRISRRFEYPVVKPLAPPPPTPNDKIKSSAEQEIDFHKLREKSILIGKTQLKAEIIALREIRDK